MDDFTGAKLFRIALHQLFNTNNLTMALPNNVTREYTVTLDVRGINYYS